MGKLKSTVKTVAKVAKVVAADVLIDKMLVPIVPGGAPVVAAAKLIASAVQN